ncbi:MAG: tetratricopeptide repeat protein, partial [Algoriella sp.]
FITATCYITFGEIQENKGNIKLAEESYLKAYPFIKTQSVTSDIVTLFDLSQLLSAFYEKTNQTDKALKYNKESLQYMQTAYEKTLENKRKFLEAYYDLENKNQEIKQLEEKNKIYTRQRILYIGIISLALAGLVFLTYLIRYRHKLNKQKTDLLESEKIESELTLQLEKEEKARLKAEKDLAEIQQEHSQKQALAVSIQLNHKNTFINELKEKVKDEKSINIDRFLKDEKIVDNNFDDLNNTIQNVHPNFFKKLASVSKNKLSNQDLKYATYIYLNMDNQRIATLLKVESKTVRMTKYRLKQKIGLQKEDSLTDFIQNLDL